MLRTHFLHKHTDMYLKQRSKLVHSCIECFLTHLMSSSLSDLVSFWHSNFSASLKAIATSLVQITFVKATCILDSVFFFRVSYMNLLYSWFMTWQLVFHFISIHVLVYTIKQWKLCQNVSLHMDRMLNKILWSHGYSHTTNGPAILAMLSNIDNMPLQRFPSPLSGSAHYFLWSTAVFFHWIACNGLFMCSHATSWASAFSSSSIRCCI